MNSGFKLLQRLAISAALLVSMAGFAGAASRHSGSMHNSKETISSAQQSLKSGGYYRGEVDGISGRETQAAVRRFQHDNNLAVTGRLDPDTLSALGVTTTGEASRAAGQNNMQPGQSNMAMGQPNLAAIKSAQSQLQKQGFYSGAINGTIGPLTQQAIRNFQQANNLTVNGQLDQATLSALGVQ